MTGPGAFPPVHKHTHRERAKEKGRKCECCVCSFWGQSRWSSFIRTAGTRAGLATDIVCYCVLENLLLVDDDDDDGGGGGECGRVGA